MSTTCTMLHKLPEATSKGLNFFLNVPGEHTLTHPMSSVLHMINSFPFLTEISVVLINSNYK